MADFSLSELSPDQPAIEVLDVGAFDDAKYPAVYKPLLSRHARVTGFEPDLGGCLRLRQKYGAPHRFFPLFVGNGQPARFHATNRAQTGSLFPPNTELLEKFLDLHEFTTVEAIRDVNTVRLDDVLPNEDIDFLKIDVQGSELMVFEGGEELLKSVVMIYTEVEFSELYKGQPLFADIDAHLRSRGFWFHTFPAFGAPPFKPLLTNSLVANQALWADAIYTRHPLKLAELSNVKLWKMAVLLHDICRSFDFVHYCLSALDARTGGSMAETYRARLDAGDRPRAAGQPTRAEEPDATGREID